MHTNDIGTPVDLSRVHYTSAPGTRPCNAVSSSRVCTELICVFNPQTQVDEDEFAPETALAQKSSSGKPGDWSILARFCLARPGVCKQSSPDFISVVINRVAQHRNCPPCKQVRRTELLALVRLGRRTRTRILGPIEAVRGCGDWKPRVSEAGLAAGV